MKREVKCSKRVSNGFEELLASLASGTAHRITSEIPALDELIGGFRPGGLTVLLGDSGSGKSALFRTLALEMSREKRVLAIPLQDDEESFFKMMIALESGIEPRKLVEASTETRVAAIDASDRIQTEHELDVFAVDEFTIFQLLQNRASEWFCDGCFCMDPLEGEGAILLDSLPLVESSGLRETVRDIRSLVSYSEIAVIATCPGDASMLNDVADAATVLLLEREANQESSDAVTITVLKDDSQSIRGNKATLKLDKKTLRMS